MRTTGIRLIAEYSVYKRVIDQAKRDTKDFKDEVERLDGSGRKASEGLDKAAMSSSRMGHNLDDAGASGRKATDSLDSAGRSASRMGDEFAKAGKVSKEQLAQMRQRVKEVDQQIAVTKRNLAGMGTLLARGGGGDEGLVKAFRAQQSQLRLLTDIRKFLPKPEEMEKAGERMGGSMRIGFLRVSSQMGAVLGPVIAGAAVVALPFLGAAIAGTVLGAAGVGGVIGGLVMAGRDPRVKQAAEELAHTLDVRLKAASTGFVDAALGGLHHLQDVLKTIDLEGILGDAAKFVQPLERGIAVAVQRIAAGLRLAFHTAGPVIDELAIGIARLGDAVGDMFRMFSEHSAEAAMGLKLLLQVVEATFRFITESISFLSDVFGVMAKIGVFGPKVQREYIAIEASIKAATKATWVQGEAIDAGSQKMDGYAGSAALAAINTLALKTAQGELKTAQDALATSLDRLTSGGQGAALAVKTLKTAADNMYGAAIAGVDANEAYHKSWLDLSKSIKDNGRSLGMNTAAGLLNRDALEALLTKSNELYLADIGVGMATDQARKKHENRTKAIIEEAHRLHLNKTETQKLIDTYGKIPGRKITELLLNGVAAVAKSLDRLYRLQRALALGQNINMVEGTATVKAFKAQGGPVYGPGTGTSDSVPIMASHGEHVLTAAEVSKAGGHDAIYAWRRQLMDGAGRSGYAEGGVIARVDESRRWPFVVNVKNTRIPSQAEALSKVQAPVPRSGGPTLDFMIRVVRAAFPGLHLISGYRPGARTLSGAVSYHALHRASDWPPSLPLAEWINYKYKSRTKELITPWQNLNIHNGARHSYSAAVYRQHSFAGGNAHDHWAMMRGGVLREPVYGVGASGRTYSFAEAGPETVIPGTTIAGGTTYAPTYNITVPVGAGVHPAEAGRAVVNAIKAYERNNGTTWRTRGTT